MKIVVCDKSKGKAYKKTKRIFKSLLIEISNRCYIGNLPSRIIKDLLCNVKRVFDISLQLEADFAQADKGKSEKELEASSYPQAVYTAKVECN